MRMSQGGGMKKRIPVPVTSLIDMTHPEIEALGKRIQRGSIKAFRLLSGEVIEVRWSRPFEEFRLTNKTSNAKAWTAEATFQLIKGMNRKPRAAEIPPKIVAAKKVSEELEHCRTTTINIDDFTEMLERGDSLPHIADYYKIQVESVKRKFQRLPKERRVRILKSRGTKELYK